MGCPSHDQTRHKEQIRAIGLKARFPRGNWQSTVANCSGCRHSPSHSCSMSMNCCRKGSARCNIHRGWN
eukprot:8806278-Prorocentrum_lima.AAC.1